MKRCRRHRWRPWRARVLPLAAGAALALGLLPALPGSAAPTPPTAPVQPVPGAQYFKQTGHNMSGAFLAYYLGFGGLYSGLDLFGPPRTEAFVDPRFGRPVQYTDRFMLQMVHGQVQAGPLGRLLSAGNRDPAFRRVGACAGPRSHYVARTGHCIPFGRFLSFWRSHQALLGDPISERTIEPNGDGSHRTYYLQWFENGRLEFHPENAGTHYVLLLGLLSVQYLEQRGWLPTPKGP